jgi:hypothetical protein
MSPALALLILVLLQAPASGLRVAGRVIDGETGKPVVDAVVTLTSANADGFSKTFTVGADGLFQFVNIPRGSYQLRTQHPKPVVPYRSESLDIDLKNDLEGLGMILSPAVSKVPVKGRVVMSGGATLPRTVSSILFSGDAVSMASDGSFETRLRPGQAYDIGFPNTAAGAYVASVSGAGSWRDLTGTWTFREGANAPIEIVIGIGRETIAGRVTDVSAKPVAQAMVTLVGPAPLAKPREITLTASGTFTLTGMRPGDYELRAQIGNGDTMLAAFRKFSVGPQARTNLEVVLKPATNVSGSVVVIAPHTLNDLMKFNPSIQIIDVMGIRPARLDSKGAFQFKSFEGDYTILVTDLPLELRVDSISKDAAGVEIRIGGVHSDRPDDVRPGQPTRTR